MKSPSRESWCLTIILFMMIALVTHLLLALRTARANERALSHKVYETTRQTKPQ